MKEGDIVTVREQGGYGYTWTGIYRGPVGSGAPGRHAIWSDEIDDEAWVYEDSIIDVEVPQEVLL